jgi:hypothetical protein
VAKPQIDYMAAKGTVDFMPPLRSDPLIVMVPNEPAAVLPTGPSLPFDRNIFRPTPGPKELVAKCNSAPPYQRPGKRKYHLGLKVPWNLRLSGIIPLTHTQVESLSLVHLVPMNALSPAVYIIMNVEDCPDLKIAPADIAMWVSGETVEIGETASQMGNTEIKFVE